METSGYEKLVAIREWAATFMGRLNSLADHPPPASLEEVNQFLGQLYDVRCQAATEYHALTASSGVLDVPVNIAFKGGSMSNWNVSRFRDFLPYLKAKEGSVQSRLYQAKRKEVVTRFRLALPRRRDSLRTDHLVEVRFLNKTEGTIFSFPSPHSIIPANFYGFVPPEEQEEIEEAVQNCFSRLS